MKWMSLAFPFIIIMDIIVYVNFFTWHQQSIYEFEQRQLDLQVNYAVDAAAQEMLKRGTHIETDYIDWGSMDIEPEIALDVYEATLLRNFGWADSKDNRVALEASSIPFFLVATYDGYYVYGVQKDYVYTQDTDGNLVIQNTTYPKVWTPKLPYSETVGSTFYMYNLGEYNYATFSYDSMVVKYDNPYRASGNEGTKARAKTVISECITDACNAALFAGLEGKVNEEWYIPDSFSTWSKSNPIESPTVLTYICREDLSTVYDVVTFGIGGSKIDESVYCICYTKLNGDKCYTYADNRDDLDSSISVENVVNSPEDAAKLGYYYDVDFIGR